MTNSRSVYIRLSSRDIASIDAEAKRHGVTRSAIARRAIRAWLRAVKRRRAQRGGSAIEAELAAVLRRAAGGDEAALRRARILQRAMGGHSEH